MRRAACLLLLLVLVLPPADGRQIEASERVSVNALAVAQTPSGLQGVTADVEATALAGGSGQVFLSTKPLTQADMQGSARQAAAVAASLLGLDWRDYDFLLVFRSDSPVVGGPSAGAVMATALTTALWNLENPDDPWEMDPGVAATGTINPDGTVGPVGGVPAKAEGAAAAGLHTVLYPAGQETTFREQDGRPVEVDMDDVCADLAVSCHAVATVQDVLRHAAGVDLERPPVEVPGTADYRRELEPRVRPELDLLEARIASAREALAGLGAGPQEAIGPQLEEAEERRDQARAAFEEERFYTAATRAFQGLIQVGAAENRTELHRTEDVQVVGDAVEDCAGHVGQAEEATSGLRVQGRTGVYAVGAAQHRVEDARALEAEARQTASMARSAADLDAALLAASFCTERARTAIWWADLEDAFGPGPALDLEPLLEEVLERTRESVSYAQAVLGGQAGRAQALFEEAQDHRAEGRQAAALLGAVDAQVAASMSLQTVAGDVPPALLDAARDRASRAIAQARTEGVEPMLAVSQVELAEDLDDPAASLSSLWTARSLALLGTELTGPVEVREAQDRDSLMGGFVGGLLIGGASVAVLLALVYGVLLMVERQGRPAPRGPVPPPPGVP